MKSFSERGSCPELHHITVLEGSGEANGEPVDGDLAASGQELWVRLVNSEDVRNDEAKAAESNE